MAERKARNGQPGAGGLAEEIAMLRSLMQQVLALAAGDLDIKDLLRVVDGLGRTATRLAALLKAQRDLDGSREGDNGALSQALEQVLRELGEG